jgi:hypothetical protein
MRETYAVPVARAWIMPCRTHGAARTSSGDLVCHAIERQKLESRPQRRHGDGRFACSDMRIGAQPRREQVKQRRAKIAACAA